MVGSSKENRRIREVIQKAEELDRHSQERIAAQVKIINHLMTALAYGQSQLYHIANETNSLEEAQELAMEAQQKINESLEEGTNESE